MAKPGRPPKWTEETKAKALAHIFGEVASGRSLDHVLSVDEGMPGATTFWRWHMEDEEIRDNLARSRENGVERHVGEMIRIADDTDADPDPASRRVRIYAREKAAQMIAPRKYGPKIDVTSGGEKVQVDEVTAATRLAAIFAAIEKRDASD
jgi:hypothetical protein